MDASETEARSPSPGRSELGGDDRLLVVVGFDGSEPSYRALDAATRLIANRVGFIEIVYVAHPPVAAGMSADAQVEIRSGFDAAESEFAEAIGTRMDGHEQRWRFRRRDGVIAHELLAAADELIDDYGGGATVVIVVGSAVQTYHHVVGSVPVALVRHARYPVVVVP
ncbi:MAG: universal stress protein [Acidimicrobiales bacterium]|jgi:nucleotide-binding universal stress UspA family protein